MSSVVLSQPPTLHEQLDIVGQRYRGQRVMHGALFWLAVAAVATIIAVFLAHALANADGQARRALPLVPIIWALVLVIGAVRWMLLPLIWAPRPMIVARLIESRLGDLHNGPTNALQIAADESLGQSGWRDAIVAEVESSLHQRPLQHATPWSNLQSPSIAAGSMLLLLGLCALLFPAAFAHGWSQMLHPTSFVPQAGVAKLLNVSPGDTTLVAGQPLDISADISLPATIQSPPQAKLLFDNNTPALQLTANPLTGVSTFRYADHFDHVDRTFRYRFDIAGTQSQWFTVTVVQQIQLKSLMLKISPPAYLRAATAVQNLSPAQLASAAISAPQGSSIQLSASVDVAVDGALLQTGQDSPAPMNASTERTTFSSAPFTLNADTPLAILLTDKASQVIAKLPADPLILHATADAAPTVQMQWPPHDITAAPNDPLTIRAHLSDDHGLTSAAVLLATDSDSPLAPVTSLTYANAVSADLQTPLNIPAVARRHGNVIRIQVQATDNRQLPDAGPQTTASPVIQITFEDPAILAQQQQADNDRLRAILLQMLKTQQDLAADAASHLSSDLSKIRAGQSDLRGTIATTAQTYPFTPAQQVVQKTLAVLALNPAKDAIDSCDALAALPAAARAASPSAATLLTSQRRIIDTLQSLLTMLGESNQPATQPVAHRDGHMLSTPDAFKNLDDALKQFMAQQEKILSQTASLAKIPADNFSADDKAKLEQLRQQQDDLDAFLQGKINDFSTLAEQDFSNASLAKDLSSILTEVTMAKNALQQQATKIAVPEEENGLELAKEIDTNIERWLANSPDRVQWSQEDLPDKQDIPMPELPTQLQDMVGQLMEQEEDLLDSAEDMNANITDSGDKGIGWDAMDGPIADMSAKGVTGNVLPNNNEMDGRSGEGRNGQSQGEFVGDSAVGKGGRRTPTRLDPTPFEQGQINDTSKDPTGGATGGGKLSGEGSAGLEGTVPPDVLRGMHRLATKQADIRNAAERLNLQLGLSRYDNFKFTQSIMLMRRVESDLDANRYNTALRTRDQLLDDLATSRMLLAGQVHVQQDTTPTTSLKLQQQLDDAAKADLPAAWSEPLKQYYQKLAAQAE